MKVICTGLSGFLGRNLKEELDKTGIEYMGLYGKSDCDLMDYNRTVLKLYDLKGDILVNCASAVGGIGLNMEHPASLMFQNTIMGFNLVQAAITTGIKRIIQIGTVCSYPRTPKIIDGGFIEESLFENYPDHSNRGYGISKLAIMEYLENCEREYGIKHTSLIMANMYGKFDDYNDESSHVIPALIKRIVKAKQYGLQEVECWGTGEASRDMLWASDGCRAIIAAIKNENIPKVINVGTGIETKVKYLVGKICEITRYAGNIKWLKDKPDGQPRRVLNIDKARTYLDWEPKVDLNTGLRKTIEWYKENL